MRYWSSNYRSTIYPKNHIKRIDGQIPHAEPNAQLKACVGM